MSKKCYPIIIAAIAGKRPLEECSKQGILAYDQCQSGMWESS